MSDTPSDGLDATEIDSSISVLGDDRDEAKMAPIAVPSSAAPGRDVEQVSDDDEVGSIEVEGTERTDARSVPD